jgi:putative hydrolase of the HAD superfamily
VRERFVDGEQVWRLFDDTREALARVRAAGRQNVVVSNHVPELGRLVTSLGLDTLLDDVFSSATTGYEKPHPEAFISALRGRGRIEDAWMIGDNPHADVAGAEALGIPAVLIRTTGEARHTAPDALGAAELLLTAG